MKRKLMVVPIVIFFFCSGCGIRGYHFATHPGQKDDKSAGDITHASEPGARVVVPNKPKP